MISSIQYLKSEFKLTGLGLTSLVQWSQMDLLCSFVVVVLLMITDK